MAVVLSTALLLVPGPALGQTPAGSSIQNTARFSYQVAGQAAFGQSNPGLLLVAEWLDVVLSGSGAPSDAAATTFAVALRNGGNGQERFDLAVDVPPGVQTRIVLDTDGDGRFDPQRDVILAGQTPLLAPGETVPLLVVATGAQDAVTATLRAQAATGSGAPGAVLTGAGDGGGDAVIGPTGAAAQLRLSTAAGASSPTLSKSQTVRAPDGTARAIRGATITYTLEARFPAATRAARIDDVVPAGTRFEPGSLSLDGVALTDAADGDAGAVDGASVAVSLGDLSGPTTRRVQFSVQIQ